MFMPYEYQHNRTDTYLKELTRLCVERLKNRQTKEISTVKRLKRRPNKCSWIHWSSKWFKTRTLKTTVQMRQKSHKGTGLQNATKLGSVHSSRVVRLPTMRKAWVKPVQNKNVLNIRRYDRQVIHYLQMQLLSQENTSNPSTQRPLVDTNISRLQQ